MNNGLICCFTGHRTIEQSHAESLVRLTDDAIEKMIERGVTVFRNGGAVGFDTLAALKVIEKKKKYPHIRLEMYLPCKEQSKKWNDFSKAVYEFVLTRVENSILTRAVVLEFQENVAVFELENVFCFAFIKLFHTFYSFCRVNDIKIICIFYHNFLILYIVFRKKIFVIIENFFGDRKIFFVG